MSYDVKNYTEPGGDVTVIGGVLKFEEGAVVEGLPNSDNTKVANIPTSTATTVAGVVANFNALLAALKASGVMEADNEG